MYRVDFPLLAGPHTNRSVTLRMRDSHHLTPLESDLYLIPTPQKTPAASRKWPCRDIKSSIIPIYNFSAAVQLQPHRLLLRPREDHELRVETSLLNITPTANVRWHRDVEDNSVAIATFTTSATQLRIESSIVIQQYNETPLDFVVESSATLYPFSYSPEDRAVLAPYIAVSERTDNILLSAWVAKLLPAKKEPVESYVLLRQLSRHIFDSLAYQVREEPGVQTPQETLQKGTGSCRDFANLLMEACRCAGLAARFVSGYLYTRPEHSSWCDSRLDRDLYPRRRLERF